MYKGHSHQQSSSYADTFVFENNCIELSLTSGYPSYTARI